MNYQLLPKLADLGTHTQGVGAAPLLAQRMTPRLTKGDHRETFSFSSLFQHPPAPALCFAFVCQQQSRREAAPAKQAGF